MITDYIIAIDPDVDKSGIAILNKATRQLELKNMAIPELLDFMPKVMDLYPNSAIYIEAGWLIKTNWHLSKGDSSRVSARKGNSTGRNHEVGRIISQMAKHYGLTVEEIKPLPKKYRIGRKYYNLWSSKDGKITHDEFCSITGYAGRTNQETRDAGLIAWQMAGLPMNIKPIK